MKYRVQRATGAANIAMTVAPAVAFQIEEVRVHLSAGGAATNLTITVDSGTAAAYDIVLLTQAMNGVTDLVWQPDRPYIFSAGDEIDIAYANGGAATYGVEVIYSAI
jgi:hypothetical protein